MTWAKAVDLPGAGELVGGKYRLEEVIGEGGMGVVWAATHIHLGTSVAVKFVVQRPPDVEATARLLREARLIARMTTPHVVRVLDMGVLPDDAPFLVMELLDGEDLGAVSKRRGPLPIREAVEYIIQAAEAVSEAHRLGIIHRDLKPSNLFVTHGPGGAPRVKVLDFGVAKLAHGGASDAAEFSFTRSDALVGSPLYMAPEQASSPKTVDERVDVWGLGMTLWHLLVGRPAFQGETLAAIAINTATSPLPDLRALRAEVSVELCALISQCLAKQPAKRPNSVDVLGERLRALVSRDQLQTTEPARAALGARAMAIMVSMLLIAGAIAALIMSRLPPTFERAPAVSVARKSPSAASLPPFSPPEPQAAEPGTPPPSASLQPAFRSRVARSARRVSATPPSPPMSAALAPLPPPPTYLSPGLFDRK